MEEQPNPNAQMTLDQQIELNRKAIKEILDNHVPLTQEDIEQCNREQQKANAQLNEVIATGLHFAELCQNSLSNLQKRMQNKFQQSQDAILSIYNLVNYSNEQITRLNKKMIDDKIKVKDEEAEIQKAQTLLQYQKIDQQAQAQYKAFLIDCDNIVNAHLQTFAEILDQREIRNLKIHEFLQSLKVPVYSIKNPPAVQKRPKTTNNHNRPRIEFNPQAKELIFRVQTFECKIVEFILFYDEESEKFGIKNPSKVFESFDMDVVRTFNYHKDINKLYSEFCLLVVYFIDDADDLPIYEGH